MLKAQEKDRQMPMAYVHTMDHRNVDVMDGTEVDMSNNV